MAKTNNLNDYLADLYLGIRSKNQKASKNPQNFRREIEAISTADSIPEWDPTNFTVEGEAIEPTPYKLSGKWLLNDAVTNPSSLDMSQHVSFTSNGVEYAIFEVYASNDGTKTYIDYGDDSSHWKSVYDSGWYNHWGLDAYRKVDFGTTPQEVSREFYAWFIENAATNEITYPAMPVYGQYTLKETLDFSCIPTEWFGYTHYVSCSINGTAYIGFSIDNGTVYAIDPSTFDLITLYDSDGWKNSAYIVWSFTDATVAVSTLFCDWLMSNTVG